MRKYECNQTHKGKGDGGTVRCKYRCTVTKYEVGRDKMGRTVEKVTDTLLNQCRLIKGRSKTCSWPNNSEDTCNIAKHK